MPFHSLNFNFTKQFKNNTSLTLRVRNLLDDERESLFEGYGGTTEYFRLRHIGRSFSLGYSIKF
jgi:outer membrane receptor protein involved in Fe transport